MGKQAKSQWDFGELFPTEPGRSAGAEVVPPTTLRKVLTVAELTSQVKRLLETQVGQIWVTGEVTNLRAQSSGHIYFTLKDAESQLSCVLFRNEARESRAYLQDGRKVVLQGDLTVYEPRGQYQMRVIAVELQGIGALQIEFEKLKQRLNAEGLFAADRKRPIPRYPQRIGIVTSPTGAALQDVLHVVQRRNPGLEMVLAPCRVQGQGAGEEIAAALRLLNEFSQCRRRKAEGRSDLEEGSPSPRPSPPGEGENRLESPPKLAAVGPDSAIRNPHCALDLVLVTRGGGSLEDLWAFNEEVVARAIFESQLPVISAVGHEIDFTISDFVADLRAATPSAAAEIITEGVFSSCQFLAEAADRMRTLFRQRLEDKEYEVEQFLERLARVHPRRRVDELLQRMDDLQSTLARCMKQGTRDRQTAWRHLRERLVRVRPAQIVKERREVLRLTRRRLGELAGNRLKARRDQFKSLESRLRLLGPEQVLARGYSITMRGDTGEVVRNASEVEAGQELRTRLKSGEVRSVARDQAGGAIN
jgi:exodeoxyribonuclease VII large subunit